MVVVIECGHTHQRLFELHEAPQFVVALRIDHLELEDRLHPREIRHRVSRAGLGKIDHAQIVPLVNGMFLRFRSP